MSKLYLGTKKVYATLMNRQEYVDYRGWELPTDENGSDEGYLIEYVDGGKPNDERHKGYISWSPKGVFDQSYKEISNSESPVLKYNFITDKTLPEGSNLQAVVAVRLYAESIDYHTAIYGIGGEDDKTFVLAQDDIGQVFTIDQIEGYFIFDHIDS